MASWISRTLSLRLGAGSLAEPRAAVTDALITRLDKYDPGLDGIVLEFKDVKILNDIGIIRQDDADIYLDIQVQFLLFQPQVEGIYQGVVNKKCSTHLSLLIYKKFNVVIPRPSDDTEIEWLGDKLQVGEEIEFKIVTMDLLGALPYIKGVIH